MIMVTIAAAPSTPTTTPTAIPTTSLFSCTLGGVDGLVGVVAWNKSAMSVGKVLEIRNRRGKN